MILYIQFECDDDIHKQVEETIDFYAGGIVKDLRKPDKYQLFKDAWLINVFFKYPDVETATRDIHLKLYELMRNGKGRFVIFNIPEVREEFNKVLANVFLSVNAIAWLNEHVMDKEEKEFLDDLNK